MKRRILLIVAALLLCPLASAKGVTLPESEHIVLDNGTVLILTQKPDVPMVGFEAVLRGGASADPASKSGLAALYASLIEKGAGARNAADFAETVAGVGGELSARAGLEAITISGDFLARDTDLMVELLADMLRRPTLARGELDKLKARSINLIRAAKDGSPGELMPYYFAAWLFADHPYGTPNHGSEGSISTISHRDIQRYHEQAVGGDRLIISVSGYFDVAEMRDRLAGAFGDWRAASEELTEIPEPVRAPGNRVLLVDKPGATQTYFSIGNIGVARNYEHRADLDIANTVFGGRFSSMLNTALRIDSGLTYGASSRLVRSSKPGSVAISSFTQTDTTIEAIDLALDVLDTLQNEGVPADMVASARNYILGQFPTGLETATQLAGLFATLELYRLDKTYISAYAATLGAVTPESLRTVIDVVYPAQDDLVFVLLGDAEQIREAVTKYGPVTEMSITEPYFFPSQ